MFNDFIFLNVFSLASISFKTSSAAQSNEIHLTSDRCWKSRFFTYGERVGLLRWFDREDIIRSILIWNTSYQTDVVRERVRLLRWPPIKSVSEIYFAHSIYQSTWVEISVKHFSFSILLLLKNASDTFNRPTVHV